MTKDIAILAEGLNKSYGTVEALRGIDLEVHRGEIFGYLGPNGAGKTTTIRCLLDLIRPNGGTLRVLGIDPQDDPVAVRSRVGYLPGELQMDRNMKVKESLRYLDDLRGNSVDWGFVRQLAHRLDLDLKPAVKNLSHGNRQKVGVVQALMHRPELLVLDEPTLGLDPLVQQEVLRLLREAQEEGATVFFSSHIISEVEAVAERVGIIRQGIIVEVAEPASLIQRALHRATVRFREEVDPKPLAAVPGVRMLSENHEMGVTLEIEGEMDALIKALASYPVVDFETRRPSLEEVFLSFYKSGEPAANDA
ncbi:MAG: ATP-binding cassette domain-containing protein [Anaerolineae bacterium]